MLIFLLLCVSVRSFITPPLSSFPGLKSATATASVCSAWKSRMKGRIPAHLRTVWARQRPQPCCRSTVRNTSCILYLNTHTHTFACIKNLTYQEPVFMHTLTCSHMTTASFKFPFPVQRSLFLYQCIWVPVQWCCQELMLNRMDYAIWQMFGRCVL